MASDCEAEKNTNVEYSPLWKRLAKTARLPTGQESKHSPKPVGRKTIVLENSHWIEVRNCLAGGGLGLRHNRTG